eukprot:gene20671-22709_t
MDERNLIAVKSLLDQKPKTIGDVKKMLGLLSYYRRTIPLFAKKAKPIYELLTSDPEKSSKVANCNGQLSSQTKVNWTDRHQETLKAIIQLLTSAPIFAFPDPAEPYILHTDASQEGLGVVLYQKQKGKNRIIAFASRALSQTEKNYKMHAGKLEFLALKWAITDQFRDYLYYAPSFKVYTDNNPLTYVMTTARLNATGIRWVGELADYNFTIHYHPGKSNGDADGLSRLPMELTKMMKECTAEASRDLLQATIQIRNVEDHGWVTSVPSTTTLAEISQSPVSVSSIQGKPTNKVNIRQHQLDDIEIHPVIKWKEQDTIPTQAEKIV